MALGAAAGCAVLAWLGPGALRAGGDPAGCPPAPTPVQGKGSSPGRLRAKHVPSPRLLGRAFSLAGKITCHFSRGIAGRLPGTVLLDFVIRPGTEALLGGGAYAYSFCLVTGYQSCHCRLIYWFMCKVCFVVVIRQSWSRGDVCASQTCSLLRMKDKGGRPTSPHPFIFYLVTTDFCCFMES